MWFVVLLFVATSAFAQSAPPSPNRPWTPDADPRQVLAEPSRASTLRFDPTRTYSLAELIDLAQQHNPDTGVAWEQARAQAAALGVARSELYPTLTAAALAQAAADRPTARLTKQRAPYCRRRHPVALNTGALFQFYEPMRTAMPPVKRQIDGTSSMCLK